MGRATLLALSAAAALAAGPEAAPGRFDALVDAGRARQAVLAPLFDELEALRRSYAWERDEARAEARREDIRGRLTPELKFLDATAASLEGEVRRFTSEHGLETLNLLASGLGDAPPEVKSAMRGQTFMYQARTTVRSGLDLLNAEEREWAAFRTVAAERRFSRRVVTALVAVILLVAAFAIRLAAVLRRRRNERTPEILDRRRLP
ncbi:MAG: hypothetical protein HYV15_05595 [Elusimicrobia bacterium]|nr:hypothetical protein [Elusimicrobiota bacterium]